MPADTPRIPQGRAIGREGAYEAGHDLKGRLASAMTPWVPRACVDSEEFAVWRRLAIAVQLMKKAAPLELFIKTQLMTCMAYLGSTCICQ